MGGGCPLSGPNELRFVIRKPLGGAMRFTHPGSGLAGPATVGRRITEGLRRRRRLHTPLGG